MVRKRRLAEWLAGTARSVDQQESIRYFIFQEQGKVGQSLHFSEKQ
jgi:hypothetical protein